MGENEFEEHILKNLIKHRYLRRSYKDHYDVEKALDPDIFIEFLKNTQSKTWNELKNNLGVDPREEILSELKHMLKQKGTLWIFRNELSISNKKFQCFFKKPTSSMNPDLLELYKKNIVSVMNQIYFNKQNSVDLIIFVNGIPVITIELKNSLTKNSVFDAIEQYKSHSRNASNLLFSFKRGALVHFAVDEYEVYMTTKIQGEETKFVPFNKGWNNGKGNPPNKPYQTSYFWEEILQPDILLDLLGNFVILKHENIDNTTEEKIIFPRYHQLRAVQKIVEHTKNNGSGQKYLVEHAPGGGKSNTISWLSSKLYSLFDKNNDSVFDSILVISDKLVIKGQLSNDIRQVNTTPRLVKEPENGNELLQMLENQTGIIITTQQKFQPVIEQIGKIKNKKFGIIIDEAHSSQGGHGTQNVRAVLTSTLEKIEEIVERGIPPNLSYFAFTATPRPKTLELFGTKNLQGKEEAFDLYPMKQAIEEGMILDVIKNYTTYKRCFELKLNGEDKLVDGKKATSEIIQLVDKSEENLNTKAEFMVEFFRRNSKPKIGGLAKSMIVTGRIELAMKYYHVIKKYLKEKNYSDVIPLVAFSGSFFDEDTGKNETEKSLNKLEKNETIESKFNKPEYNMLVTAAKFQEGFDQPLLHCMFIDTTLEKIHAVQTLSRLNRTYPGKPEPIVVDFVNEPKSIQKAFQRYYTTTILSEKTDPIFLKKIYDELMEFKIINESDVDSYWNLYQYSLFKGKRPDHAELIGSLEDARIRYMKSEDMTKNNFQMTLVKYVENYSYFTLILTYDNQKYEKLYRFGRSLISVLPENTQTTTPNLKDDIAIKFLELEKIHEGNIELESEVSQLSSDQQKGTIKKADQVQKLSEIIVNLNKKSKKKEPTINEKIANETLIIKLSNDQKLISKFNPRNSIQEIQNDEEFNDRFDEELDKLYTEFPIFVRELKNEPGQYTDYRNEIINYLFKESKKLLRDIPPIKPGKRLENRYKLRTIIRNTKEFLYWDDPFFNEELFDFMDEILENYSLNEIKLIGSITKEGFSHKFLQEFKKISDEISEKGKSIHFKIETVDKNRAFHNRYLITTDFMYNLPSVTELNRGRTSSFSYHDPDSVNYKEILSDFDKWWNSETALDVISDWNKIQDIVYEFRGNINRVIKNCSICNKEVSVPNVIIEKNIPIYCPEHNPKY